MDWKRMDRWKANLRLGTGTLIVLIVAAAGLMAQQGVGLFNRIKIGPTNQCTMLAGAGAPNGAVTGNVCDFYLRTDGLPGNVVYVKGSGSGNTGWEQAGSGGGGTGATGQAVVRKTADQSVTSSTVLVNDTHLFFNIAASETWAVQFILFVDAGSTGDLKVGLSVPSGATYTLGRGALVNTAGTIDQAATSTTTLAVGGQGGGTVYAYQFNATVVNSTTAGAVFLQFAQNTSDGTATTLKTNSVMVATPVGSASAAITAGSYVLLQTKDMTGLGNVDFVGGFSSAYDDYEFRLVGVKPVVNNDDLLVRFSTDGGATFISTATYDNAHQYVASNNTTAFNGATGNTSMDFCGDASNAASASGCDGVIHLFEPANSSTNKIIRGSMLYSHGSVGLININRSHIFNSTTAVNGVRFFYPGGNAAAGTIRMYGISKQATQSPGSIITGTLAARPTTLVDGRIYLPNDGLALHRDTGNGWATWGPLNPLTAPPTGVWSWQNQGSSTISETNDSLQLVGAATGAGTNLAMRFKTAPATPYTITARLVGIPITKLFLGYGVAFRQNGAGTGTGRIQVVYWDLAGVAGTDVGGMVRIEKWSSPTVFSASYTEFRATTPPQWFRISDDGANLTTSVSNDGINFVQVHQVTRLDYMLQGADQVGFFAFTANNAVPNLNMPVTVLSWKEQ